MLPRRRKRFWRYVSPRRHGIGAGALAVLAMLVYVYWHQTNDRRIRLDAERYLRVLTGGPVDVRAAHFSFFGGIELNGVKLFLPGARRAGPFLDAQKVVMRHRPWSLVVRGRLYPTEIVCTEPVVTLEYQARSGTYNVRQLFQGASASNRNWTGQVRQVEELPRIYVRDGRLKVVDVDGEHRQQVGEVPVDISMSPAGREYEITFEETGSDLQKAMQGKVVVDLASGQITHVAGRLPLESLSKTLPVEYSRWSRRYGLEGEVQLTNVGGGQGANTLTAELAGVSMRFPESEGGLEITDAHGELVFDEQGVELKGVTGLVPQAGNCRLEMSGKYEGYAPTAPFTVTIAVSDMVLPGGAQVSGSLAEAIDDIRREYSPQGAMDLSITFHRGADGAFTYQGTCRPKGMSMVFRGFPCRVDQVAGDILLAPDLIEMKRLTARRGRSACRIDGESSRVRPSTL